jgi:hypothetical protein
MNYADPAAKKILNSGAGKAVKGAVQKVIKKLAGSLLDKLMSGLTNQFGEYFLFLFVRQEWQIGAVKTRIEGQRKLLTWFGKVTGKKQDELMLMIKKGIEKKFGMTLQELFKKELGVRLAGRNVPGIGYVVVVTTMLKYLPTIVTEVGKFIGEMSPVKPSELKANASNMDVLAQELDKKFPKQKQDPKPNPPHGGGKGQPVGGDKISLPPDQRGGKGTNNGGGGGKNNGGGGGTNNGGGTGGNNNGNNGDQTPIDDNNGSNTNNDNNGSNTNGNNGNTSSGGISTGMMVAGGVGLGLLALAMNSGKGSKRKK